MVWLGPLNPMELDPRISTLRPAWLADDQAWRNQLQALDLDDDIRWIEHHWEMAEGPQSSVDTSWITMTEIGPGQWGMWPLVLLLAAVALPVALLITHAAH